MALLLGFAATCFTFLGGLFALKYKDKLHLILGFSAGAVVAVAFFDLLPESMGLVGYDQIVTAMALVAAGFAAFMVLDRTLEIHGHGENEHCEEAKHAGFHGAGALVFHSFLDGLAIGMAFRASAGVGVIVAAAVLAHDFSDGINTVNYILKTQGNRRTAFQWLFADALAPVMGVVAAHFAPVSSHTLGFVLAVFAGFFLYIGASDLIPESHHRHPKAVTTLMTLLGMLVLYAAVHLARM